jgi:1,2-phenylacetyl-CoA epoxidase PaaB subunit
MRWISGLFPRRPDKRVAIVGNGYVWASGKTIDRYDVVIRCNQSRSYPRHGRKINILALTNSGQPALRTLHNDAYIRREVFDAARSIWLVRAPEILKDCEIADGDHTEAFFTSRFASKPIEVLSAEISRETERRLVELGARKPFMPSTGILVIAHALKRFPDHAIDLFGFSHQGWEHHPWKAEKQLIKQMMKETPFLRKMR